MRRHLEQGCLGPLDDIEPSSGKDGSRWRVWSRWPRVWPRVGGSTADRIRNGNIISRAREGAANSQMLIFSLDGDNQAFQTAKAVPIRCRSSC